MRKVLLVLLGESGTGKTTIANRLKEKYGLRTLLSYTTRPKRKPDENDHTYVTIGEYVLLKDKVAENKYSGYMYCSTKEQIANSDVYVCDCPGTKMLKEEYDGDKKIVVIRLSVPREERIRQMEKDKRTLQTITIRDIYDSKAFEEADKLADYMMDNDDLEETVDAIYYIYSKEREEEA